MGEAALGVLGAGAPQALSYLALPAFAVAFVGGLRFVVLAKVAFLVVLLFADHRLEAAGFQAEQGRVAVIALVGGDVVARQRRIGTGIDDLAQGLVGDLEGLDAAGRVPDVAKVNGSAEDRTRGGIDGVLDLIRSSSCRRVASS